MHDVSGIRETISDRQIRGGSEVQDRAVMRGANMKVITGKFMTWLMGRTRLMRCFVIAVLFHVVVGILLGSIKIVAILPKIIASFDAAVLPPVKEEEPDPFAAFRDFDYSGPTLGG